jgi:3-hydroxyisobutyrate dehydrogenase
MGKPNYMGTASSGQHTKISNQIFIASGMIALVEGLVYGYKAGLNLNSLIETCSLGAAGLYFLN